MLEKIVTIYRKAEMAVISGLSGASAGVIDETSFYDVGYMQSQIGRIQKELKRITSELENTLEIKDNSDYGKKHIAELIEQRERLLFNMIFLASNSFKNLDDCMKMAEGHKFSFMQCVQALNEYHSGSKEKAFQLLEVYYRKHGSAGEHYLVNKVFGLLLAENGFYAKAVPFLTYALQFVPNDTESLDVLKMCYGQMNESGRARVISEILVLLDLQEA